MFSFDEIAQARKKISGYIHKTPVLSSQSINELFNCEIIFKCENFQKGGSFKIRGAMNTVLSHKMEDLNKGVITHSSGNHAQALSIAAKSMNIPAYIVMPENSSSVKVEAVKKYGGKITFCQPNLHSRENYTQKIIKKTGALFVPPYDNIDIIKGQATVIYEVFTDGYDPDIVMAPVGGGGLLSGTAISINSFNKKITVYGAEPANANDAYQSFKTRNHTPVKNPDTIADGLRTSLGEINFRIILNNVDDILLCSEKSIINSMQLIFERMKIVVEPSAAVALACIIDNPWLFVGKRICLVISGGNIDIRTAFKLFSL